MRSTFRCNSCEAYFQGSRRRCWVCGTLSVETTRKRCTDCGAQLEDVADQQCPICGTTDVERCRIEYR